MASKKQKVYAGLFIVAAISMLVVTVAYLGGGLNREERKIYKIEFTPEMSVSGLSVGAKVKFKGVPIGAVSAIDLNAGKDDSGSFAVAYLEIEQKHVRFIDPVRTRARLLMGGITGSLSIDLSEVPEEELSGEGLEPISEQPDEPTADPIPIIRGEASDVSRILERTPQVVLELHQFVARMNLLIDRNQARFGSILAAIDVLATEAAPRLATVLDRGDQLMRTADARVLARGGVLDRLEGTVDGALKALTRDVSNAADEVAANVADTLVAAQDPTVRTLEAVQLTLSDMRTLIHELHGVVRGNRQALREMVVEVRNASEAVEKVMLDLKKNPAGLIWGEPKKDGRTP